MSHPPALGMNLEEYLDNLHEEILSFSEDDLNNAKAGKCAIAIWHLHEWIFEHHRENLEFASLNEFRNYVINQFPEIQILRDLANEMKHAEKSKHRIKLKEGFLHNGSFSKDFSNDFDVSRLILVSSDGQKFCLYDILNKVLTYWEKFSHERELNM